MWVHPRIDPTIVPDANPDRLINLDQFGLVQVEGREPQPRTGQNPDTERTATYRYWAVAVYPEDLREAAAPRTGGPIDLAVVRTREEATALLRRVRTALADPQPLLDLTADDGVEQSDEKPRGGRPRR